MRTSFSKTTLFFFGNSWKNIKEDCIPDMLYSSLDINNYDVANCVCLVLWITLCHSETLSQVSPLCSPSLPALCSAVQLLVLLTDKRPVFSKSFSFHTHAHTWLLSVTLECPFVNQRSLCACP